MTPDANDRITAVPPAGHFAPPGLRLRLDPTLARGGILDGGWWPRSRNPDAELPDLIAGLESLCWPAGSPRGCCGRGVMSLVAYRAPAAPTHGPEARPAARQRSPRRFDRAPMSVPSWVIAFSERRAASGERPVQGPTGALMEGIGRYV
jgi:hypothetical protein